ncbi:MAG: tyrosine-protein phosphatase [Actinomycetota bacterium]
MQRSRELVWEGCLNVRDLGGHATEDGSETRYGAIVRADSLHQLTEDGWQSVVDYGIRTVVDLRMDEEREGELPPGAHVDLLHISLFNDDKAVFEEIDAAADAAPDAASATKEVYLLFLEHFKTNVATAIRAIAQAPEGGVVVHCMGGKDRTGLITAILLELAGVDDDQIAADYALSEERLKPRHELWFAEAETEAERERLRRIAQTPAASIAGVLAELQGRYGGVEGYLKAAGLSDEDLALARARLRA